MENNSKLMLKRGRELRGMFLFHVDHANRKILLYGIGNVPHLTLYWYIGILLGICGFSLLHIVILFLPVSII